MAGRVASARPASATYVRRQPTVLIRRSTPGVSVRVPRPVPAKAIPMARPRLRLNQRATSDASGPRPRIVIPRLARTP